MKKFLSILLAFTLIATLAVSAGAETLNEALFHSDTHKTLKTEIYYDNDGNIEGKTEILYNDEGIPVRENYYECSEGNLELYEYWTYEYTGTDKVTITDYDAEEGSTYYKRDVTYNEEGLVLHMEEYEPAEGGSYVLYCTEEYAYDAGKESKCVYKCYDESGTNVESTSVYTYSYDENGYMTEELVTYTNSYGTVYSKGVYAYDVRGIETSYQGFQKGGTDEEYVKDFERATTFDAAGVATTLVYDWDAGMRALREIANIKLEYTYVTIGSETLVASETTYRWTEDDGGKWNKTRAENYTYDADGDVIKEIVRVYDGEACETSTTEYTYYVSAPVMLEGDGQTVDLKAAGTATFRSSADFSTFVKVTVDGEDVDAQYYDAASGSTVVTLSSEFLATLSAGTHTIGIVSTSGTATANFTITDTSTPDKDTTPDKDVTPAQEEAPATSDSMNIALYVMLGTVALAALAGEVVRRKKTH